MPNRSPLPDGYHTLIPDLAVAGAVEAIAFYQKAFGAREVFRLQRPGRRVLHAELRIGDTIFFLADEQPELGYYGPKSGGAGVSLVLNVDDVDAMFQQAIEAGAEKIEPVSDHFWGDRMGTLRDPFGHIWSLSTHMEDVSPEEISRRMEQEARGR